MVFGKFEMVAESFQVHKIMTFASILLQVKGVVYLARYGCIAHEQILLHARSFLQVDRESSRGVLAGGMVVAMHGHGARWV